MPRGQPVRQGARAEHPGDTADSYGGADDHADLGQRNGVGALQESGPPRAEHGDHHSGDPERQRHGAKTRLSEDALQAVEQVTTPGEHRHLVISLPVRLTNGEQQD